MESHPTMNDFELLSLLGKGHFATVYLVRCRTSGQEFALKVLKKHELAHKNQIGHSWSERNILASTSHPFIVHLHAAFQSSKKVYFLLEYCPGGSLYLHLHRMTHFGVLQARFYAACVLLALEHLHSRDIVYRE